MKENRAARVFPATLSSFATSEVESDNAEPAPSYGVPPDVAGARRWLGGKGGSTRRAA